MQTMQDRILNLIEKQLADRGYASAVNFSLSNVGDVYIFASPEHTLPIGQINFDFQDYGYKVDLTVKDQRIPSQIGRADYFDFYQKYSEPTRFWEVLAEVFSQAGWCSDDGALLYLWRCECGTDNRDDFGQVLPDPKPDKSLPCAHCEKSVPLPPIPESVSKLIDVVY